MTQLTERLGMGPALVIVRDPGDPVVAAISPENWEQLDALVATSGCYPMRHGQLFDLTPYAGELGMGRLVLLHATSDWPPVRIPRQRDA